VKLLVELGADVNISNQYGDTALHKGAWKNYEKICELLVNNGAAKSRSIQNKDGKTPFQLCRNWNVQKLVAIPPEVEGEDEDFDQEDEDSD